MFITIYQGKDKSIFIMSLKIMNQLLRRGFIIFCLIHPLLSIFVLNSLFSMALHESLHLAVYRKLSVSEEGFVSIKGFSLRAHIPRCASKRVLILSTLAPSFLGLLGVLFLWILKSLNLNNLLVFYLRFMCFPWTFNLINILWFSPDMKTLFRLINNL